MTLKAWSHVAITAAVVYFLGGTASRAVCPELPFPPNEGEALWRWIHLGPCPSPLSGWTAQPLFSTAAHTRCPSLPEFCVHEKSDYTPATPTEVGQLLNLGAEPDVLMGARTGFVGNREGSGTILNLAEKDALEQSSYEQMGRLEELPMCTQSGHPKVRLTLVDTSPDIPLTDGSSETSPHGETLTVLAKSLLCTSPNGGYPEDCIVDVRTRLGLAYTSRDPWVRNETEGGVFGLIGELAEALMLEVDDWAPSALPQDRLVLNLSVAWDRRHGGDETLVSDMPVAVQAVYRALECAACDDRILTVAAAGNFQDLHPANITAGPLFPAAWTKRVAEACPERPLLRAAGSMDVTRNPLAPALASAMPEFGVYSDHVIVKKSTTPPEYTATISGTSVAALGLSAAVAAVTYYVPSILFDTIFDTIYQNGAPTPIPADFCQASWPGNCPTTRYISLCESVQAACSGSGCCAQIPGCSGRLSLPIDVLDPGVSTPVNAMTFPSFDSSDYCQGANCNSSRRGCDVSEICTSELPVQGPPPHLLPNPWPALPPDPCPQWQFHAISRRIGAHPQPQSSKCPNCKLESDSSTGTTTFYGEIEGLAPDEDLRDPTLILMCGGNPHRYYLSPPLWGNNTITVENLPGNCSSAVFSYTLQNGNSVLGATVPILVGW